MESEFWERIKFLTLNIHKELITPVPEILFLSPWLWSHNIDFLFQILYIKVDYDFNLRIKKSDIRFFFFCVCVYACFGNLPDFPKEKEKNCKKKTIINVCIVNLFLIEAHKSTVVEKKTMNSNNKHWLFFTFRKSNF